MTVTPRTGFPRQALRLASAALGVPSLAACSDGHPPPDDVPQIDPAPMTQTQLLAALNALGKEPHLGKRWRHALHADCEREVSLRNGETDRGRVVLEGAVFNTQSADGVSEIRLVPKTRGETQAVIVPDVRKWSNVVRARSLFAHLEARCGSPVMPAA